MRIQLAALVTLAMLHGLASGQQATTNRQTQSNQVPGRQQNDQQQGGRQEGENRDQRRGNSQTNAMDELFANLLAIDNAAEIQISREASTRLQNEQVKQFAEQMIQEHEQFLGQLAQFGAKEVQLGKAKQDRGEAGRTPTATNTGPGANSQGTRPSTAQEGRQNDEQGTPARNAGNTAQSGANRSTAEQPGAQPGSAATADSGAEMQFVAVKKEIAEQCVQSAKDELASKTGREADRCFVAAQVFDHQKMLDCLTVFQRHASPDFAETLAKATETTQQHLAHAKQLLQSLEDQGAAPEGRSGSESGSSQSQQPSTR